MSPNAPGAFSYRNPIEIDDRRLNTDVSVNAAHRPDQPDNRNPAWYS
jgi:hypothetical protein